MKNLLDAGFHIALALPNGAASATASSTLDLGVLAGGSTALGSQSGGGEFLLAAPVLSAVQLPDGKTMTYDLVMADSADLVTNPATLVAGAIVQTGAGGAGAAAATYRIGIPSTVKRFIGLKATGSAAGDASGASATLDVAF